MHLSSIRRYANAWYSACPTRNGGNGWKLHWKLAEGAKAGEEDIITFARDLLGPVKAPKCIHVSPDLPRSPVGKVIRAEARDGRLSCRGLGLTGVNIVGIAMLKTGRWPDRTVRDMAEEVCRAALAEAELAPGDVQAVWFSNTRQALMEGQNSIRGQAALRGIGFRGAAISNIENACALPLPGSGTR